MANDRNDARTALGRERLAPFLPWRLARTQRASIREADHILRAGWVRDADRQVVALEAPFAWDERGLSAVATAEMHGWVMVDPLLIAHSATGSWSYLQTAVEVAEDWMGHGAQTPGAWDARTAAGRAHRLAYIAQAAAAVDAIRDERWSKLAQLAERHADELRSPDDVIDAMFVAVARESLHTRLGTALNVGASDTQGVRRAASEAVDRKGALASGDTSDHIMAAAALASLDPVGDLESVRRKLEDGLAWLITTDGQPANFGATALEPVNGLWRGGDLSFKELTRPLASTHLAHALTAGAAGQPPTSDTHILDGAGIMVSKPVWTGYGEGGAYVAMSRTDGSLVWHDRQRALLIAPGTTGAALSGGSGARIERSLAWLDRPSSRNAPSFDDQPLTGSTTSRVGVINETTFFDITADQEDSSVRRTVVVAPGRFLLVADRLSSANQSTMEIAQKWLIGPGLDAIQDADSYHVSRDGEVLLWAATVHGEPQPTGALRGGTGGGWWAPRPGRVAPATQIGWTAVGTDVLIISVFALTGPVSDATSDERTVEFAAGGRRYAVTLGPRGLEDMQEKDL